MDCEEALNLADQLVISTGKAKELSRLQKDIFRKSWKGMTYKDIATADGYTEQHIKKEGSQLWQLFSEALEVTVTKKTFRAKLEARVANGDSPPVTPQVIPKSVYHNLPAPEHTRFVEREELKRLISLLANPRVHRITIEGIGGVGKTTLALEAAYRCLQASYHNGNGSPIATFDAVIFTSAKKQYLGTCRILPRIQLERTLSDIFRAIARTLNCLESLPVDFEEQLVFIRECLTRQKTLLIIDNLETIEDQEQGYILSFLLDNLPYQVKVVITTRVQTLLDASIHLESLPEKEGLELISYQAEQQGVELDSEKSQKIYQTTCGIPVAIIYAIGQVAYRYSLDNVLTSLTMATNDIASYCFESSLSLLRGQPAHKLLMALALFSKSALKESITNAALLKADSIATDYGLAQLQQLSLVKKDDHERYSMLPLTRGYVIAELEAHPEFEQKARERWLHWYRHFVQQNGTKDWKEWNPCEALEEEWENLQEAIEWCVAQERYKDFWEFWQHIKGYTHFAGYWNERLRWMDWLMPGAKQERKWEILAEAMFDKGRTLTMMHQPQHQQEAMKLFESAWQLYKSHNLHHQYQIDVGIYMAIIHIEQQHFEQASYWLSQVNSLLDQVSLPKIEHHRLQTTLLYYQAKICLSTQEYSKAKVFYESVLEKAQQINWQRVVTYSQIWLAEIAIQEGRLEEAANFLNQGMPVVENNKDKRCLALCKRSLALLEKAKGDWVQCRYWAAQAKEEFQNLGMLQEVAQMQALLRNSERGYPPLATA